MNADAYSDRSTHAKLASSSDGVEIDSVQNTSFAWWTWARVVIVVFLSIVLVWRGNEYVHPGSGPTLVIPLLTAVSAIIFVLTALAWAFQKTSHDSSDYEHTQTV